MAEPIRVLLVEDNPNDAELLLWGLRRAGFEPEWQRVETETDYLRLLAPDLDLILSDYQMPTFDGLRALQLLKTRGLEVPFIIVSGSIGEETAVEAMKQGAMDYLLKDRLVRLGQSVRQALDQGRLRQQGQEAALKLQASEDRLRSVVETIADVIWVSAPGSLRPTFLSPAVETVWGHPPEHFLSGPEEAMLDSLLPEDRPRFLGTVQLQAAGHRTRIEYRIRWPDGSIRWILDQGFPVRDAAGRVTAVNGIASDITDRKHAEDELRRRTAFFEGLVHSSPDGILVVDAAGRKVLQNQRMNDLWQIPRDVVENDDDNRQLQFVTSRVKHPNQFVEKVAHLYAHPELVSRDEIELVDGTILDRYSAPVRDQQHAYYGRIWSFRDITERRRVERRRNLEHAVARILAESASLAEATPRILAAIGGSEEWQFGELWSVDATDGRLVCQETWSVPGLPCEELAAHTRQLRLGADEGLPGWAYLEGDLVVIPEVRREPRFVRAPAAGAAGLVGALAFPLRGDGPVAGVLVFLGSRRMEVDSELREMLQTLGSQLGQFMARKLVQEELRRFVALSPSVIYALRYTPAGLRAYWVSDNLLNLTGYHPAESMHGSWWTDHLHPDDRERVLEENAELEKLDHQVIEFRFRRQDGAYISLRDEKRLRRDAAGKPVEVIGAWTDITGRVNLEKQLRQAQKMEAVGQLSGGIAHDFNNLLGTIIGNAQLAVWDLAPEHPATEGLEQILSASRRATHLVQQILTFARREQTERHRISPLPVAEESVRLLRATLPAGVQLSLICGERLPEILADETQIQQVLINLGTNSWHAMEGRAGRIAVELSAVDVGADRPASLSDLPPGAYLRIRVEDTGKGMDAATLERIFEPFFTTKEVGKGTGLGLSVVHGIIKAHGGAVTVRSEPGTGTTFELFLPTATGGDEARHTSTPVPLRTGHGELLLLIEDQGEMRRTHQRFLERLGYRVVTCQEGTEALARFRAEPAAFALVLTDLNMPGLSGVELARIVLELRPELPVLLTSGFIPEEVRQSALAAGVREILRKPVLLPDLSEAIFRNLPPVAPGTSRLPSAP